MMTNRIVNLTLAGLALAGAALPVAVNAQADVARNAEARTALSTLGRCLASVRASKVGMFLRSPSDATWNPVIDYRNDDPPCEGQTTVTASGSALRGAVSEGWYLATYPDGLPAAFTEAANTPPSQEETAARIMQAEPADRPQMVVDEFARCVAATAPVGVDALVRTPVASSAEAAAIKSLSTSFAPCAFEGQKLGFDAETLRAALAYALARRVVAGSAA